MDSTGDIPKIYTKTQKRFFYLFSWCFTFAIAAQNGLLGFSKTSEILFSVIAVTLFIMTDLAMGLMSETLQGDRSAKNIAILAISGCFLISVYAGASFWLMQMHKLDKRNSQQVNYNQDIAVLRDTIAIANSKYAKYEKSSIRESNANNIKELSRLRALQQKDAERFGINVDSSNALAWYISKWIGYSYDVTSFTINFIFNIIMIVTAIALSMMRATIMTNEDLLEKRKRRQETIAILNQKTPTVAIKAQGLESQFEVRDAKNLILDGKVKPSIAELARNGVPRDIGRVAIDELRASAKIERKGNSNHWQLSL